MREQHERSRRRDIQPARLHTASCQRNSKPDGTATENPASTNMLFSNSQIYGAAEHALVPKTTFTDSGDLTQALS